MQPLNGKCRMTREERNARRRELNKNPFHRDLELKRQRAWRERNKDKMNALRRENYAANKKKHLDRARRWRASNPEKVKAAWKKWADANRDHLRERGRLRRLDPKAAERKRELRKIRDSSPEGRAKHNESRKAWWKKSKDKEVGIRWYMKCLWIPRWRRLELEGPDAEEKYLKRCNERTRAYYRLWKAGSPIVERILKGGKA